MSADNALALREHEGRYVVTHESGSAEKLSDISVERGKWFRSYEAALDYIYAQYDDLYSYYEYGPWLIAERPETPQQFVMVVTVDGDVADIDDAASIVNAELPNSMSVRPLSEVIAS